MAKWAAARIAFEPGFQFRGLFLLGLEVGATLDRTTGQKTGDETQAADEIDTITITLLESQTPSDERIPA